MWCKGSVLSNGIIIYLLGRSKDNEDPIWRMEVCWVPTKKIANLTIAYYKIRRSKKEDTSINISFSDVSKNPSWVISALSEWMLEI